MEGVARTTAGALRGVEEPGVWVFKGIPYARVGAAGRWRAAHDPLPWTGTRVADTWGPIAPQSAPVPGFSLPGDPTASDEDCLNLNVWTPRPDGGARPVMVWVHGGGFTTGTGSSALFSGRRLASRGVVVVTINYRLGALGLLAHPELADDGDGGWGNWSLHDQITALGWVQDNIGAFGGDPANVTVFGESAGAMSIAGLLASSAASGLFHRAVLQSGPPATASAAWAMRRAEQLAHHAGVPGAVSSLRDVPADRLVEATQHLAAQAPRDGGLPLPLLPVVDDGLLDRPPGDVITDGYAACVPLLVGTTRDETALFTVMDQSNAALDDSRVGARLVPFVGHGAARDVVAAYAAARRDRGEPACGRDLWTAVTTDYVFRLPLQALAAAHAKYQAKTFSYLFTWESPFLGGVFGSCHGLEIPFVFGTVEDAPVQPFTGSGPAASRLSEQMQAAWVAFARDGDPSCEEAGEWPAYDAIRRQTMVFGPGGGVEDDPRRAERLAWEEAGTDLGVGHHHH